jgi:hypothetical protein
MATGNDQPVIAHEPKVVVMEKGLSENSERLLREVARLNESLRKLGISSTEEYGLDGYFNQFVRRSVNRK